MKVHLVCWLTHINAHMYHLICPSVVHGACAFPILTLVDSDVNRFYYFNLAVWWLLFFLLLHDEVMFVVHENTSQLTSYSISISCTGFLISMHLLTIDLWAGLFSAWKISAFQCLVFNKMPNCGTLPQTFNITEWGCLRAQHTDRHLLFSICPYPPGTLLSLCLPFSSFFLSSLTVWLYQLCIC